MRQLLLCIFLLTCSAALQAHGTEPTGATPEDSPLGVWEAWLESPGGKIPFELDVMTSPQRELEVALRSGGETTRVPVVRFEPNELLLEFVHYDSRIRATWNREGKSLDGEWSKRAGLEKWSRLEFHARRPRSGADRSDKIVSVAGRWAVDFSSEELPAVGIFEMQENQSHVRGTFLTAKGDYRYLAGRTFDDGSLELSCFDGAHAFLFKAKLQDDGTLAGDFWSRDTWHETWTARRDETAALPDPMRLTRWQEAVSLEALRFPDPDGRVWSLADPALAGKARIIEVFGTWCPNCNDATRYFVELQERFGSRGLSIVALAFELTGDFERDAAQVQRYREYHGIEYPILVAGLSDKKEAAQAFPALDRVLAFPTTIFLDAAGNARAIYTGFSGPATGPAYDRLRQQFESLIEEILSES
ncbi:MAG: TlpA family protein disulfide reductase [Candidatus Latescibacterota bacterium]|nr:MAG: TlpA family protein disulfide reductase [Candidatus Latescibacterota bacterium]